MNEKILADLKLNQKILIFQQAVMSYATNRTLENAKALAQKKAELCAFIAGVEK